MQQLQELANERADAEQRIAATLSREMKAAEAVYRGNVSRISTDFGLRRRELENAFAQAKQTAVDTHQARTKQLHKAFAEKQVEIETTYKNTALAIERKRKEAEWQALAVFDGAKDRPQQMLDQANKRLHTRHQQKEGLHRDAHTLIAMRRLKKKAQTVEPLVDDAWQPPQFGQAENVQQAHLTQLHDAVIALHKQRLPSLLLEGFRPLLWWLLACLAAAGGSFALLEGSPGQTSLIGVGVGTVLTVAVYLLLGKKMKQQSLDQFAHILGLLERADELETITKEEVRELSRLEAERINQVKNDALATAKANRDRDTAKNDARRQAETEHINRLLKEGLASAQQACDEALAAAEATYPPQLEALAIERRNEEEQNDERHNEHRTRVQATHDTDWQTMSDRWHNGYRTITDELSVMHKTCSELFPDWSTTNWDQWQRPARQPTAIQFGTSRLPLSSVKNGLSEDPRLRPAESHLDLPALMPFAELPRLVITTDGGGRQEAIALLQAAMLRFLTAFPAGKLRFTIIDPSALGENFAAYMHLADTDEQLLGTRIWTDPRQIEERLNLLADHMEKVLQKFLRNEFATLSEYNEQAGEVAEPFHVLVLANFPAGLSDAAMRKLQTIATAGPRCGVYTLMSIDTSLKMPTQLDVSPLLQGAVHLEWAEGRLRWNYPLFEKLPLELDTLPPTERFNALLRAAGEASQQASRVEVPFAVVAPDANQLWLGSTARELVVPIGRSGAKDLQALRLGRGTSQHVVISGKTGSGKSTLLHALITNLALHYSPDEVEFYLVDFKKGVEFKTYATGQLPHARVIAIESEREFGVSVLERLDEELRRRGERFRELGVQDLAGARDACDDKLPRVLLVIDEFQELFVADDKLAQDASLLLDRLVRQGRAFGIHVLLGSQTLAGAYSLARSTIGQMAVRIALECSEADAHLILSDENSAARLLTRPGEAIYNDQNGMVEGNSPFQVVWLPDAERQGYLGQIRQQLPADQPPAEPAIVFEGNVAANPSDNRVLVQLIDQTEGVVVNEPTIWLGSAVRIEPPTQLTLRRQSGNNLLIVGQDEPLALGILATAAIALSAQQQGTQPCVTVLDGTRPESPDQNAWSDLAHALPGKIAVARPGSEATVIAALAEEVEQRSESPTAAHAPRFLIVHDLSQFRALRQTEDEFSFSSSSSNKPPAVDKQFRNLLREGPEVGVHVLVWCDSYNGLTRFVDRLTLREIDYRIALQMSAADSTSLIDSPAAGRIGQQRAVFYRDDLGTQVKFRPYGRPASEWIAWVAQHLSVERVGSDAVE